MQRRRGPTPTGIPPPSCPTRSLHGGARAPEAPRVTIAPAATAAVASNAGTAPTEAPPSLVMQGGRLPPTRRAAAGQAARSLPSGAHPPVKTRRAARRQTAERVVARAQARPRAVRVTGLPHTRTRVERSVRAVHRRAVDVRQRPGARGGARARRAAARHGGAPRRKRPEPVRSTQTTTASARPLGPSRLLPRDFRRAVAGARNLDPGHREEPHALVQRRKRFPPFRRYLAPVCGR